MHNSVHSIQCAKNNKQFQYSFIKINATAQNIGYLGNDCSERVDSLWAQQHIPVMRDRDVDVCVRYG